MIMDIMTKIDEYRALLDEKDRLKELTSDNNKLIERCRDELAQMMINEEVPKVSRSGYSYTLQEKTKYSKSAGADEELFSLLRAEGLGDLIKETVSPQTLQVTMSFLAEENGGDLPEEYGGLINVYSYFDVAKRKDRKDRGGKING